jgi:phosphoglycolate phosphatase
MTKTESQNVFFDLDGTLTDPKIGITRSIQYALKKFAVEVPSIDELTWCIGPPLLENFEKLLDVERAPDGVRYYRERFATVGLYENVPYPRIQELLGQLREAGIRLFVASSKPEVFVRKILEHFKLIDFFEEVFASELDGARSDKTDLLGYAIEQTGVDPKQATMIGDRKHDIIGARNNQLSSIGVLYGYGSREELESAGANRLAASPDELAVTLLGGP